LRFCQPVFFHLAPYLQYFSLQNNPQLAALTTVRSEFMIPTYQALAVWKAAVLMTGLLTVGVVLPSRAQTSTATKSYYEISEEITLNGTISAVFVDPTTEMARTGCQLRLTTRSEPVYANLGRWGLQSEYASKLAPGQHVQVTGVLKSTGNHEILVARLLKVGSKTYTIRNRHGISLSPEARRRAIRNRQNGDSL
jgi:hypothetical protein